jgi:hypothetical protein
MPASYYYSVQVTLPIGLVTIEADYLAGHFGTYWEPPEPDEVLVHTVTGTDGVKVCLTDEQNEEYYDAILEAVGNAHSAYLDGAWNKAAEDYLASQDTEIPY